LEIRLNDLANYCEVNNIYFDDTHTSNPIDINDVSMESASEKIANDLYEDMEKYRFQNYFEYEYYKAIVYYWSKFEKEYQSLTFEEFINNYEYYLNMEDKIISCYSNFRLRGRDFVINPNFYFEKTKTKFRKLNTDYIIGRVKGNEKTKSIMKSIKIKE
jgi:hypothetical protein